MTVTITRRIPDLNWSLRKWLETLQYAVGSTTGTLKTHFAGLTIRAAYPDDLIAIKTPVLALVGGDSQSGQDFFGEEITETLHQFSIFGFVAGQGGDGQNRAYRDRLVSDLFMLLQGTAGSEGIDLYSQANPVSVIGSFEVDTQTVRVRLIPSNAPIVEADKYKFVCEFELQYV